MLTRRAVAASIALLGAGLAPTPTFASETTHFRASTFAQSAQYEVSLDATGSGASAQLLVAWTSKRQQGGLAGIYLQRFDRDGVAIGSETQAHVWTQSQKSAPTIAGRRDGSAVVTWTSFGQDGDEGAIVARVFDPALVGGDEVLVNENTGQHQHDAVASAAADGAVIVVWISESGSRGSSIRGRVLNSGGTWEHEFVIADGPAARRAPSVSMLPQGGWIVAWTEAIDDTSSIMATLLDRCGLPVRAAEQIASDAYEAGLSECGDGAVIAWAAPHGDEHVVVVGRLDANGCPVGGTRVVGEGAGAQPVGAPDGSFVVAWNEVLNVDDAQSEHRLVQREFDVSGAPRGDSVVLTAGLPNGQSLRAACGSRRGVRSGDRIALAWHGDAGKGDKSAANVTLRSAAPIELAGRKQGVDGASAAPARDDDTHAAPHVPPHFDPQSIDHGRREIAINDLGTGFDAIVDTGWTPPDVNMAVGPTHVVAITNGRIAFLTKSGRETFGNAIEGSSGFWGSVGATNFVFDPEVIYDSLSDRFFALASEGNAPGSKSYALIAVSDDSDPNGTWFKYRLDTTGLAGSIFDSPNIGVDSTAVYVTGDGSLGNYQIFIWDKASMLAGVPPVISKAINYTTTVQSAAIAPVWYPDQSTVVLIEHKEAATNTKVKLIAIVNPLTTPTLQTTELTVASYTEPEKLPQQGSALRMDTFDARFWSADYRNGSLWATHHVGLSRVLARWYEIKLNDWPVSGMLPTLAQQGTIDPGTTVRTSFSSIGVDAQNNAVICFARGSPTEFLSMGVAQRAATDPPNTFGAAQIVKTSTGAYTEFGRWGDYSSVRADNSTVRSFWANHEYSVNASTWRTWAQNVTIPPPSADLNRDGFVNGTDLGILLGNWSASGPPGGVFGDLDLNGIVDAADLAIVLGAWTG
ncbi:MAG: hypothetical protein SGJ09_07610 [Phycisphaerae bacterium]|nr:hypothetical protein [Phycisphaerae bacterium]